MVVAWRHAVPAVTVQIEPDAVERHAEMGDDAPGRVQNCCRRRVWCGIETVVSEEPWHVYLAIVHFAPLGSPPDTAVELSKPSLRRLRIHETRDIGDPTALVVRMP
jgi:hypothetical protein